MNQIVIQVLLALYKFMSEIQMRQMIFTNGAHETFTKNKEKS